MGSFTDQKPLVLMGSTPVWGHLMPIRSIAKRLVERGYDVTFVTGSHYRKAIEEVGCTFVSLEGYSDWYEEEIDTRFKERYNYPPGLQQLAYDVVHCFIKTIPGQHAALQKGLKMLTEKHPGRPIVQVCEGVFQGGLPIIKGARGIKPTATLGLGVIPMALTSIDTAPFGPGLLPDTTPEGRARNQAMNTHFQEVAFGVPNRVYSEMFEEVGATGVQIPFLNAAYLLQDRFLQMCPPSAEYPRSDAPSSIRFAGGLAKGSLDVYSPPSWWKEDILENKNKKDVVFVCQGTVALKYKDLTVPALEGLKDRPNTLIVIAVGKKGASLPEEIVIPANARVADYIPYDELLPHASVFLTNGGYGAFQHGITNGIPLILAGAGEDKPEVSARAEWSGIGLNMRTGKPTPEAIRAAVDEVASNPKYKQRALEMMEEKATFDPMSIVVQAIEELGAGKHVS